MSDFVDLLKGNLPNVVNGAFGLIGSSISQNQAKKNFQEQYEKYLSPKAQVNALASAGINPAVAMGNNAPVLNSAGLDIPENPFGGIGTTSLSDLASYIQAKSGQKVSEADVNQKNADIKLKEAETRAQELSNELTELFGSKEKAAQVALAWKNVLLANDSHDMNLQQKAINDYRKATEAALATTSEHNRDMAKKRLDNLDTELKLENDLKREAANTERSKQSANYAAAKASNAQADLHRSNKKYQDIVNDIKESGKVFELENIIQKWRSENKINSYQFENAKFWLRRLSRLNKQLSGDDLKSKIERELDDFFWYWKDEVPNIDMPTFMIPLK